MIPSKIKKLLVGRSGGRCAFPDCRMYLFQSDMFIGDICLIHARSPGGPRFDPQKTEDDIFKEENLIVLCLTHHRLVDSAPSTYTAEWLLKIKASHEQFVVEAIQAEALPKPSLDTSKAIPLKNALDVWEANKSNGNEGFWQKFFATNPRIIALAVPDHILMLSEQCYVGGKSIDNKGGNIIDFLFMTQSSKNVTLVEIKTPTTKLIGAQYRTNAYAMTKELSGAVVQILNYRDELLKNYHTLSGHDGAHQFFAFNPQCLIVAGNLEGEAPDLHQRRSFDLFRSNLGTLTILTFDELFGKVRDLVDLLSED